MIAQSGQSCHGLIVTDLLSIVRSFRDYDAWTNNAVRLVSQPERLNYGAVVTFVQSEKHPRRTERDVVLQVHANCVAPDLVGLPLTALGEPLRVTRDSAYSYRERIWTAEGRTASFDTRCVQPRRIC